MLEIPSLPDKVPEFVGDIIGSLTEAVPFILDTLVALV